MAFKKNHKKIVNEAINKSKKNTNCTRKEIQL